jgi:Protein of unknown function (DUF3147)
VTVRTPEPTVRDRVEERPAFWLSKIKQTTPGELGIRFVAGALTSIVAGVITLIFGARGGGVLLAFPAIMAASLTLIEEEEDAAEAREDARGAIVGAGALTLFAAVAAVSFGHLPGAVAPLVATVVWAGAAVLGYVILWWRRPTSAQDPPNAHGPPAAGHLSERSSRGVDRRGRTRAAGRVE